MKRRREPQSVPTPWIERVEVRRAAPVALFVAVVALYLPSTSNGFVYDDQVLIVRAPTPTTSEDFARVFSERHHTASLPYYRPISRLTLLVQKALFGNDPAPYHQLNVVLLALVVLAAYAVFRAPPFGARVPTAFVGALLVGAHPIASSQAYEIAGRETLLVTLFLLVALYFFLRPGWRARALCLVALGLALLSKEQAVSGVAFFALADALGLSANAPGRSVARWARRYAPVAAVVALYVFARASASSALAGGVELGRDPLGPILSFLYFLTTTFAPSLELEYEPSVRAWLSPWRVLFACILPIVLVQLAVTRSPEARKQIVFWLGFVLAALLPSANFVAQETLFAERYGLTALVGVVGLMIAVVPSERAWGPSEQRAALVGVALAGISALVSAGRSRYFVDDETFLEQWARSDPFSHQAYASLGEHWVGRGELDRGIAHYERAVALNPDAHGARYNLANHLAERNDLEPARRHYEELLRRRPTHVDGRINYGVVLKILGRTDEAIAQYEQALELRPGLEIAHYNLANALLQRGDDAAAAEQYRIVLASSPDHAGARQGLAIATGGREMAP